MTKPTPVTGESAITLAQVAARGVGLSDGLRLPSGEPIAIDDAAAFQQLEESSRSAALEYWFADNGRRLDRLSSPDALRPVEAAWQRVVALGLKHGDFPSLGIITRGAVTLEPVYAQNEVQFTQRFWLWTSDGRNKKRAAHRVWLGVRRALAWLHDDALQTVAALAVEANRQWTRTLEVAQTFVLEWCATELDGLQATPEDRATLIERLARAQLKTPCPIDAVEAVAIAGNQHARRALHDLETLALMRPEVPPQWNERRENARLCAEFAILWPPLLHAWQLENAARIGAATLLAAEKKGAQSPPAAHHPDALTRLRAAVDAELERNEFREAVGWPWPQRHNEAEKDGMAAPMAQLLAHLGERYCPRGEGRALKAIEAVTKGARRQLEEWRNQERLPNTPPPASPWQQCRPGFASKVVAQVLWFDRVCGELERERNSAAALVTTVSARVGSIWAADTRQCELELMDTTGANVAWLVVDTAENAAQLFKGGSSLTFQRLIRYLPVEAHRLWRQTGRDQADVIIEGGFSALAKLIGAHSKKAAEQVREALQLGQVLRRQWADGTEAGGLWTVLSQPHAPGRPARLTITLSPILRPGFTYQLPKGPTRALVPVVPLPPLTGRERDHASQAQLQWSVMQRLVEGRSETALKGGVTFKADDWRRLCEKNGLPPSTFPRVIAAWEGSFLERVGADRWFVADTPEFTAARRHLMVQAEEHAGQAERGRRSAAKKRHQRAKRPKTKAD